MVCVGAGPVAASKALPLIGDGAELVVIAPQAVDAVAAGGCSWHRRPYQRGDLDGALLAIAATGVREVDDAVAADAAAQGTLCVRVDGAGTAAFPAVVRRGPLLLSVSTSGNAPALAARVRERLEAEYGPEWGEAADALGELRADPRVRAALAAVDPSERRDRWHQAVNILLGYPAR